MKASKAACIAGAVIVLAATTIGTTYQIYFGSTPSDVPPEASAEAELSAELPNAIDFSARFGALSQREPLLLSEPLPLSEEKDRIDSAEMDQAKICLLYTSRCV